MKAMILAAGVGSRLRPLTDTLPKALIDINGVPVLEIVLRRLINAGCTAVVINVFHFAEMIEDFLRAKGNFGIHLEISRESELLDTGGGLKKVAGFFDDGQPFFLHNVDVISNIDLNKMYRFHVEKAALATLAVQARTTGRYFLFDDNGMLCGWESVTANRQQWARKPMGRVERLAFNGIHVIAPAIFDKMSETGVFSINETYLRLAGAGEKILAFRTEEYYWRDIGRPEKLEQVRQEINRLQIAEFSVLEQSIR
ncbi:MAG: nucleotidyltransferase family protein [candidate division KSB1 bacterium]|nr:nucleotidyltransferase family protein [candidate division KSB1 bacterium]MDZ7305035.1 nucleotidyltransferase family protein [candidate division KSB1 bacterium]MDZ7312901.1 nucleotidyltransferase family protein [candidate division KSB1 bacterium]